MTKREIVKYFKQKNLYPYFVALVNQEIFFTKMLNHTWGYVPNMDEHHTTIENIIRDKQDLKILKQKDWFSPKSFRIWGLSRYYLKLHVT
jgi:hypothetical protein